MQEKSQRKIDRLVYELNILNQGKIKLSAQAAEWGVSLRTLQRDMDDLQKAEFPLWNPAPGEYAFMEGFSLEKMRLSDKEASVLVLMSRFAAELGGSFNEAFGQLRKRLLDLPEDNPFFIQIAQSKSYPATALVRTLEACVRGREKVSICYQGNERVRYPLRPLKLMWAEGFWYLLVLTDSDKLLKFRLEKITSVKRTGINFAYNKEIEKILRDSTNIWFEKERPLRVCLAVSAECAQYFKSRTYFPLQKLEKEYKDGHIELSCRAAKEEEIVPTILHWLPHVKVLEPKALRVRIKQRLTQALKKM